MTVFDFSQWASGNIAVSLPQGSDLFVGKKHRMVCMNWPAALPGNFSVIAGMGLSAPADILAGSQHAPSYTLPAQSRPVSLTFELILENLWMVTH